MTGMGKCCDKGIEKHKIWATLSVFSLNMRQVLRDMKENKAIAMKFATK